MKKRLLFCLLLCTHVLAAQNHPDTKKVLKEGILLYKLEKASWHGTDILMERYGDRMPVLGGYFSYLAGDEAVCVFFGKGTKPKVVATFGFDSTYNLSLARIDDVSRNMTEAEMTLFSIREAAMTQMKTDTLFRFYPNTNPNIIPIADELGRRVYVLTGPKEHGTVIIGNDYLITFDDDNIPLRQKRIHNNILPFKYGEGRDERSVGGMHTHLPSTGELITPTDICTLLLYSKIAGWSQHTVVSENWISIFRTEPLSLVTVPTEAFRKGEKKTEKDDSKSGRRKKRGPKK